MNRLAGVALALIASPTLAEQAAVFAAHGRDEAAPSGDPTASFAIAALAMVATLALAHRLATRR